MQAGGNIFKLNEEQFSAFQLCDESTIRNLIHGTNPTDVPFEPTNPLFRLTNALFCKSKM
jgi:hypothetical protein